MPSSRTSSKIFDEPTPTARLSATDIQDDGQTKNAETSAISSVGALCELLKLDHRYDRTGNFVIIPKATWIKDEKRETFTEHALVFIRRYNQKHKLVGTRLDINSPSILQVLSEIVKYYLAHPERFHEISTIESPFMILYHHWEDLKNYRNNTEDDEETSKEIEKRGQKFLLLRETHVLRYKGQLEVLRRPPWNFFSSRFIDYAGTFMPYTVEGRIICRALACIVLIGDESGQWKNGDLKKLGDAVKNRVYNYSLKKKYTELQNKLSETGQGLIDDGREAEIEEDSPLENLWHKRMNALMGKSPVIGAASQNSASPMDLSVLQTKIMEAPLRLLRVAIQLPLSILMLMGDQTAPTLTPMLAHLAWMATDPPKSAQVSSNVPAIKPKPTKRDVMDKAKAFIDDHLGM
ncbi:hypothetical protein M422DRAFT_274698 [Sphaerobolus stellatus SS14]|uniref:Unplaced genomic scaffold SPHSTscaffold_408, whole genome shotgun sequence n=1 Tax=Sphaerobolus stellatus (strain SS14) TaxID=990650 RepID=A0A0C9T6F5_SPHS4|nr:hypothetical protein M422DRAFT_274698 [Sphaerobolus stellatus SS14]